MPQHAPAVHRTIVVTDIAGFTNPARTMIHHLAAHEGFHMILRRAFAESGVDLGSCLVENRGDGAMVLVPPDVDKSRLTDQLPGRLVAGLRRYNAVHSVGAAMQLRVGLHSGEVHHDGYGTVSQAINFAFRILDAEEAKAALKRSGGVLALIASDPFYHEVIIHDSASEPGSYRQIPVSVKETLTTAWLRLPGGLAAVDRESDGDPQRPDMLFELVEALLAVPCVREGDSRRMLLDLIRPEIATLVPNHSRDRLHVIALVRTCLRYDGGLAELIEAVRMLERDAIPVRRLTEIARKWTSTPAG